jgi:hypothetical protein
LTPNGEILEISNTDLIIILLSAFYLLLIIHLSTFDHSMYIMLRLVNGSTKWNVFVSHMCISTSGMKEEDMQRQCRRRRERIDSVTPLIIAERLAYQERIGHVAVDKAYVDRLVKEGFGKKRKLPTLYAQVPGTDPMKLTGTAAGGVAQFMAAASKNWPVFEHMLPEIAFAGHSNCGKSTLVNAMIGISPRKGVASVSDRAGWTDQVCFYKLGKRPPVRQF